MKFISTKTHGFLDYMMGILLIASPWAFQFHMGGAETYVPIILGVSTLVYSLLTNYELGAFHVISMKTHLTIDSISGVLLAASPWIFGFADFVYLPHLILGIVELGAVMFTRSDVRKPQLA
ncbi:MAG TPA: hypothetical protein VEC12_09750 [Bacteroidia bacterium]|nr:hypothetical protein [Bacteroidia bacterium]